MKETHLAKTDTELVTVYALGKTYQVSGKEWNRFLDQLEAGEVLGFDMDKIERIESGAANAN